MISMSVDARTAYSASRRGTGKAMVALYREIAGCRPHCEVVALHRGLGKDHPFSEVANIKDRAIEIKGDRLNLWRHVRLPLAVRGSDVLHCPANLGPVWSPVPIVLTVHDLIPLDPRFAGPDSERWGRSVGKSARRAAIVTTPSQYSKDAICRAFALPDEKVRVIPWAANPACRPVDDAAELHRVRVAHGLDVERPYAIGFGGQDPRKNTRRLIQAWARLPGAAADRAQLLVVGMQEPMLGLLQREIRTAGLEGTCVLSGYVPEADLPALLTGAELLCFPTLSEGFGLPILDAFKCGTAVVTSPVTSIPEVAGDAAVYVDPESAESISDGVLQVLSNETLRTELERKGETRSGDFTWAAAAEAYIEVFEEVVD